MNFSNPFEIRSAGTWLCWLICKRLGCCGIVLIRIWQNGAIFLYRNFAAPLNVGEIRNHLLKEISMWFVPFYCTKSFGTNHWAKMFVFKRLHRTSKVLKRRGLQPISNQIECFQRSKSMCSALKWKLRSELWLDCYFYGEQLVFRMGTRVRGFIRAELLFYSRECARFSTDVIFGFDCYVQFTLDFCFRFVP